MVESFTLNIFYKGVPRDILCTLRVSAYTYQILCTSGQTEIILEKDDEGNIRALEANPFSGTKQKTDPDLVKALVYEMQRILIE